jgi:hypothetical protein
MRKEPIDTFIVFTSDQALAAAELFFGERPDSGGFNPVAPHLQSRLAQAFELGRYVGRMRDSPFDGVAGIETTGLPQGAFVSSILPSSA